MSHVTSHKFLLGFHASIAKGFPAAALNVADGHGLNAMQCFVKNPRGRSSKPLTQEEANEFKKICAEKKIQFFTAHASYLVNLSKKASQVPWLIDDLVGDFERVHMLGGNGVVVHLGKASGGMDPQEAVKNMIDNIQTVLQKTEHTKVNFLLENTAGQKSDLGYRFEDLEKIWKQVQPLSTRMKICLDTQHTFAAGYNWENSHEIFEEFDQCIGVENIACIHFNDSKKECDSHVDRHENLFQGFVGEKNLLAIAKYAIKHGIPLILETPGDEKGEHHQEIKKLKEGLSQ